MTQIRFSFVAALAWTLATTNIGATAASTQEFEWEARTDTVFGSIQSLETMTDRRFEFVLPGTRFTAAVDLPERLPDPTPSAAPHLFAGEPFVGAISSEAAPLVVAEARPVPTSSAGPKAEPEAKPDPKTAPEPIRAGAAKSAKTLKEMGATRVRLDVADWELAEVLRHLAKQTGANLLLIAPNTPKVTAKLNDVALTDVLRQLAAMSGTRVLEVGETFVVGTEEGLKAAFPQEWAAANGPAQPAEAPAAPVEPAVVTRLFTVSNANAEQVAETLRKTFDGDKLVVQAGPGSAVPRLTDTAPNQTGGGVSVGVMGRESSSGNRDGSVETGGGRLLILRGAEPIVQAALDLAKQLDEARPQVSISVTIHDISNDALRDLGLVWSYGEQRFSERTPNGIRFGSFDRSPLSFTSQIKALETKDAAKLLANPNISVLDGERAFILIGQRVNFPVLIGYTQANTPIFDRREERVGIYLQVAPRIGTDGQITLSLYPQVSTVTGFLEVNGASYPQISTREAQTSLRVASGETIVMGGLIRDEEIREVERVPILSQIPLFGELFTRRRNLRNNSQVVITITPTLIPSKQNASR